MPSQLEFLEAQKFQILDNPNSGGELKTKNTPATQLQRSIVTNRGKASNLKADVRLVTCVHGKKIPEDDAYASLIVFEYHLTCTGIEHRYRRLETKWAFRNQKSTDLRDEPIVEVYAPFKHSENIDSVEVEHSNKFTAGGNAGATFTSANAGMNFSKESEGKDKRNHSAVGSTYPGYTDGKRGTDAVGWELKENKKKAVGVPDTFRLALLLSRVHSEPLVGTFSLELDAGFKFAVAQTWKNFFGIAGTEGTDDLICFDPALGPQGEISGINPDCLGKFRDQVQIQNLSAVHLL